MILQGFKSLWCSTDTLYILSIFMEFLVISACEAQASGAKHESCIAGSLFKFTIIPIRARKLLFLSQEYKPISAYKVLLTFNARFQNCLDIHTTATKFISFFFLTKVKFIFPKKICSSTFYCFKLTKKNPNLNIKFTLILTDRLHQLGIQKTQHDWRSQHTMINVVKVCIGETSMYLFLYSILKLILQHIDFNILKDKLRYLLNLRDYSME